MRALVLTVLVAAALGRATSSVPCSSASLSTGGTSLVAETRAKVTVESGGEEAGCEVSLRVLLVGGGGDGDAFSGNAGGSGFLEVKQVRLFCAVWSVRERIIMSDHRGGSHYSLP